MDIKGVLFELRQERERLNTAIMALESLSEAHEVVRRERQERIRKSKLPSAPRRRRRMSAAARKRISEAAKERWAQVKRAA